MKEKGIITDKAREMVRELAGCNVPIARVNDVVHAVSKGLGVNVADSIDKHSVSRIILEGKAASEIQLVHEIHESGNITLSGDGTTNKHINFEAKHGTMRIPDYASNPSNPILSTIPTQRFFGISTATDHKSETQLRGWVDLLDRMYKVYNSSPLGRRKPLNPLEFARLATGMNTDHAEDQKKLFRLFREWKEACEREMRGEEAILSAALADLIPLLWEETERNISDAGGREGWEALSADIREAREREAYRRVCIRLGQDEMDKLTPDERRYAALFIWGGCCMHKEMNSVKGGTRAMAAFWDEAGVPGPMKFLNRDNAAAANLGTSAARDRAVEVSQCGAVKLTTLAGHVLAHKDKKKGQQDSLQVHLQLTIGYMVRFPDTSNTRYQSHCEAAAELLVRLDFYREFMLVIRDLKEKRTLTNIELNVYNGLHDIPTLTELSVLVLYSQAISHPYMRQVRGPDAADCNLLDMGPIHDNVKAHCQAIIDDPDLLMSPEASYERGSMDGKIWERTDAVYAVLYLVPSLPHLRGALVAFFSGALETWNRFTAEYAPDGLIASTSATERQRAFMPRTNDDNEGRLGGWRRRSYHAPSMTLDQHNAREMYKKNGTGAFIRSCLGPEDRKWLRKRAREEDSSGIARQRREAQAKANQANIEKKRKADVDRQANQNAKRARIDGVTPRLDVASIQQAPGTIEELDLQLEWHRRHDPMVPKKKDLTRKIQKIEALVEAVKRYNIAPEVLETSHNADSTLPVECDDDTNSDI
ncbi:hypothetical protein FIBSPDRAFT_913879 [Athelia psychrophila]|uniref:Uncharacterized protein n=1 Tax=Athelia psychrophila TaxID=1759441 RepID=A0A165Z811_9AGAM|nr:hypothetical protein FIBSPDRAFT_913879 [Fibularhizoctonia sp. CBS 109695]